MKGKLLLLMTVSVLLMGCQGNKMNSEHTAITPTIHEVKGSYMIDIHNPREQVGSADYVMVGKVNKLLGTEYQYEVEGKVNSGIAYTKYEISVIENIKGTLTQEEPIVIYKEGGVSQDGNYYELHEDDLLPEEGKEYVFIIYAQEDGSNLVSAPNSNIPLAETSTAISTYAPGEEKPAEDVVNLYKESFANEIPRARESFVSNDQVS